MALTIAVLVIACGAIAAGSGYLRVARRMRSFRTVEGRVTGREVAVIPGSVGGEGRWGRGGRYLPKVTYQYTVDGVAYTGDRWSYASNGLRHSVVEQELAAIPDRVAVFFDPSAPDQAYLHIHTPRMGYVLLIAGVAVGVAALVALLG